MNSIKKILPPQPHYISGYAGYVPGYKFHSGRSYGKLTHDLFLDPAINRSDKPVLTDLTQEQSDGPSPEEKKVIENRCKLRECNYGLDMAPGYKGYVPHRKFLCGHNFTHETTKAINVFEKIRDDCLCPECTETRRINQNTQDKPTEDLNEHTHPLQKIAGGEEFIKEKYKQRQAMAPKTKAYSLENEDPQKRFMSKYSGHVPNLKYNYGISYSPATNEALKLFTTRYEKLKMNSPKAIDMGTANVSSGLKYNSQKFPYETGIIKNYAGHIPGNQFNVGKTFSEGSKNVRNVLKLHQDIVNKTFMCK